MTRKSKKNPPGLFPVSGDDRIDNMARWAKDYSTRTNERISALELEVRALNSTLFKLERHVFGDPLSTPLTTTKEDDHSN